MWLKTIRLFRIFQLEFFRSFLRLFRCLVVQLVVRLAVIASLMLGVVACDNPPPSGPLKLGTNIWPGYEPLYLARSLGEYKDAVNLIEYSSSSQTIRALRNGLIDAAALTLDEALILLEQQQSLQVIFVTDVSNGADALLARPRIESLEDIRGETVGVENTALGAYMISRALETAGVERSAIGIKSLEIQEHEEAYMKGLVDVIVTFDPVRTKLLKSGAVELFSSTQLPGEIVDVIVVRKERALALAENIATLKNGWYQALDYIETNPEEAYKTLSSRVGLPVSDVIDSYKKLTLPSRKENADLLNFNRKSNLLVTTKKLADGMFKNKLLKTHLDPALLFSGDVVYDDPSQ
ncbi:MAG: ABC transporter substrate-binding protein [Gammaproteobacteria bacterium]|nr:ABC transporter substrate-binding protein [Gammaproteobacteria bacterium]